MSNENQSQNVNGIPFKASNPLSKKGAFRASKAPCLSGDMIPTGTTLCGKILDVSIPEGSRFKNQPMVTIQVEGGMELRVPGWASIMNVIGKDPADWKAVIGHEISITKLGQKTSATYGKQFQVFDVVIV